MEIAKLLKAKVRCRQHGKTIEILQQLKQGTTPVLIHLDARLGTLRDQSVRWLVEASKTIKKTEVVLKVSQPIIRGEH